MKKIRKPKWLLSWCRSRHGKEEAKLFAQKVLKNSCRHYENEAEEVLKKSFKMEVMLWPYKLDVRKQKS
jgi:hypothetical protein